MRTPPELQCSPGRGIEILNSYYQHNISPSYLVKVVMPVKTIPLAPEILGHVAGDGDAEHQGDAHPERTVEVGPGPHLVLEERLSGYRDHRVEHPVLHVRGVHVKELLVECKCPEVGCFPVRGSALALLVLVYQLAGVPLRGGGRELGEAPRLLLGAPVWGLGLKTEMSVKLCQITRKIVAIFYNG